MNMVALVGNVSSEVELTETPKGKKIARFKIAVARIGAEEADFFQVLAFERQAELVHTYLQVGRRISVEGRLRHTSWRAEDNTVHSRVEIIASRIEFLGSRPSTIQPDTEE